MKLIYVYIFLLCSISFYAQNNLLLNGKIEVDIEDLKGINVNNSTQNYQKQTTFGGYFSIRVSLNDTLIISSDNIQTYQHVVKAADFDTDLLKIKVKKSILLDEINIYSLDAVAMGILQRPAKQYTPLERKLRTASGGYEKISIGTMMAFPVDPILNAINGRTKQLKKAVALERISRIEVEILQMFDEETLITQYNIPEDKINLFLNYAAYDIDFVKSLSAKNKGYSGFKLARVATKFHKLQQE